MQSIILSMIQENLEEVMQKYDRVATGFAKFFNQEELFRVLDNAVD